MKQDSSRAREEQALNSIRSPACIFPTLQSPILERILNLDH